MDGVPLEQLERELEQHLTSSALADRFSDWSRREPVLARFRTPVELLRFLRGRPSPFDRDAVLRPLVDRAASEIEARHLVLLVLLPGLKNLSRRLLVSADEREELWASLLASAWERICSYSITRRPNRIAANLLLDTMRAVLAERRHERATDIPSADLMLASASVGPEGDVDALLRAAVSASAITSAEAELVLRTRFDGIPLADVAAQHGEPYNRVKVRRQRAERRLLVWLGHRPVPRGQQKRPSSCARVVGAGS